MDPHTATQAITYLVGVSVSFFGLIYFLTRKLKYKNLSGIVTDVYLLTVFTFLLIAKIMDWTLGR
jgi:predicted membrane channel-forming protein YqfA (hemolysin III family)